MTNTKSLFGSNIVVNFALIRPNQFWGLAVDGVEIRNNKITARTNTPWRDFNEGYLNSTVYQNPTADYVEQSVKPVVGTIFQNDICVNCPINFGLSTGDLNTVIWNSTITTGSTIALINASNMSKLVADTKIWKTTTQASTGTLVGP
ncbi:hypothetical protein [Methylocapsa acidiphila]|uniref:hypothetical protein n=1 Tax=Methylocapsa acidiphila TaxID=133552 RepID=UPI00041A8A26|nr:hypothetical protein [Methylocapsa acidiphila]